ncbi:MAG: hypothetical protein PHT92_02265 [Bacteroidales bacterium]|nr:hypothetical protein [Bacteroidales bacterium]
MVRIAMFISLSGCITFTCDEAKSAGVEEVSGPSEGIAISVTFYAPMGVGAFTA